MTERNHDRLEDLIRQADASAKATPVGRADLAGRAYRTVRRRRIIRQAAGASAVAAALVIAAVLAVRTPEQPAPVVMEPQVIANAKPPRGIDPAIEHARHLERRFETVKRLMALDASRRRIRRMRRKLAEPTWRDRAAEAAEQAAARVVKRADYLWNTVGDRTAAVSLYRGAIEHFGQTHWADLARKKLEEIEQL